VQESSSAVLIRDDDADENASMSSSQQRAWKVNQLILNFINSNCSKHVFCVSKSHLISI